MPLLIGIIAVILLFFIWCLILCPFYIWIKYWLTRIFNPGKHKRQQEIMKLSQRLNMIRQRMPYINWFADDLEIQNAGIREMEALKKEEGEIKEKLGLLRR